MDQLPAGPTERWTLGWQLALPRGGRGGVRARRRWRAGRPERWTLGWRLVSSRRGPAESHASESRVMEGLHRLPRKARSCVSQEKSAIGLRGRFLQIERSPESHGDT